MRGFGLFVVAGSGVVLSVFVLVLICVCFVCLRCAGVSVFALVLALFVLQVCVLCAGFVFVLDFVYVFDDVVLCCVW